jgi:aminopeptidase N
MFINAVRSSLQSAARFQDPESGVDPSLAAYALQLPDEATLLNQMSVVDIDRLHAARSHVKRTLATQLHAEFEAVYATAAAGLASAYQFTPAEVGRRRLQNTCLEYLSCLDTPAARSRAKSQFDACTCMTDKLAALSCLASSPSVETDAALADFYRDAAGSNLVLNKWFMTQAYADHASVLDNVRALKSHPDFLLSNPNRARSLIGAFTANLYHFHAADGRGYEFVADCIIEIDRLNPQVAARMVTAFAQWRAYDAGRQALMQAQLRRIQDQEKLSKDTLENVLRCLK